MFDIGFIELVICGVIALLVLGPERLPAAARAAGRFVGGARRMVTQFTSELDRQLKAEELRKELQEAGDVGLEDVQKNVKGALDEAKKYEHMLKSDVAASDMVTGHKPAITDQHSQAASNQSKSATGATGSPEAGASGSAQKPSDTSS